MASWNSDGPLELTQPGQPGGLRFYQKLFYGQLDEKGGASGRHGVKDLQYKVLHCSVWEEGNSGEAVMYCGYGVRIDGDYIYIRGDSPEFFNKAFRIRVMYQEPAPPHGNWH